MQSNRYLIYDLLGKTVEAIFPPLLGGHVIRGKVTRVYRDVMRERISITAAGAMHFIREPNVMYEADGVLYFVYGEGISEDDDNDLFERVRSANFSGGCIDQVLHDTASQILVARFTVS